MNKCQINTVNNNGDWSGLFGYTEQDITPPLGIYARNWGAAKFDNAIGVHKPLLLQCLIFGDETNSQKIIITADLGWWKNNDDEKAIRHSVLTHFNLGEDQFLFCLSHTHAGPSICSSDSDLPGGKYVKPYLDFLKNSIIDCIERARGNMQKASLNWSVGVCNLAQNRDLEVEGEFVIGFNPFKKADQTLLVGKVTGETGDLQVVICNYACHPTSFAHENRLLSPDYVGAMREVVQLNTNAPTVFLQGASGELAPKNQYVSDPRVVDANGEELGYAVLATLATSDVPNTVWKLDSTLVSGAPLALWKEYSVGYSKTLISKKVNVSVPYKRLESIEKIQSDYELCEDRVLKDRLWRKLNTRRSIGEMEFAEVPVWIWKLGNCIIVAQPNEVYSDYQKQVRAAFPHWKIVFINIANGYIGYMPPEELYANDMYAVWQTPYAKGSLEILVKETINEIQLYLNL